MPMAHKLTRMGIHNEELPSIKSQGSPILIRFLVNMVSNLLHIKTQELNCYCSSHASSLEENPNY